MSKYVEKIRACVGRQPMLFPGSRVILLNADAEILLHHRRKDDVWRLPGGIMELGESLEEAAYREVHEDVGLMCEDMKLLKVFSGKNLYQKYPNGDEVFGVTAVYICKSYHGVIGVNPVVGKAAKFFDIGHLPENTGEITQHFLESFKPGKVNVGD